MYKNSNKGDKFKRELSAGILSCVKTSIYFLIIKLRKIIIKRNVNRYNTKSESTSSNLYKIV